MTTAEAAAIFRTIAERLEKNLDEPFGGAFVACPPDGEHVEMVSFSGSAQNVGQFWGTVQSCAVAAVGRADEAARRMRGFGG